MAFVEIMDWIVASRTEQLDASVRIIVSENPS
jgi:hypothetical protein